MIPNYDEKTDIHYGAISQKSLDPEALNGIDLKAIEQNPAAIVDVFHREAKHAMKLKKLEL